jgi:argininosuccinate lyase
VTVTQAGRGQLEAAALFWCVEAAHWCAKLSSDVILFSSQEFGWLVLPPALATGSSIMPHKRNPDLFELTRARAAALDGDLASLLALRSKLTGGYHRDFQFLKAPLFRGLDTSGEMLTMLVEAIPQLGVDAARGRQALAGGVVATDAVMQRVARGAAFRPAYRDVSEALHEGRAIETPRSADLLRTRTSIGGMGNPGFESVAARLRAARRWQRTNRRRFDQAIARLTGRRR